MWYPRDYESSFRSLRDPTVNNPVLRDTLVPLVREIYCDKGLTLKCRHIDLVPAHMAMRVCARDLNVIEYTTITELGLSTFVQNSESSTHSFLILLKFRVRGIM